MSATDLQRALEQAQRVTEQQQIAEQAHLLLLMSSAPITRYDSSGRVRSRQYGDTFVFWPIHCHAGALHAQPQCRIEASATFSPDYAAFFDARGALDAPDAIPRGGVRADDFVPPGKGRLLIGHVWREGTAS